jgi:dihydroflavonol-4-reductase
LKVLVTGATGFLGGHLVERLVHSEHEVVGTARQGSDIRLLERNSVGVRRCDITDAISLREAMEGIDVVVHLAAYYTFNGKREMYDKVNVQGTKNLIDAMAMANVRKIIYCSTTEVMGPTPNGIADEDAECHPYYEYGRSKLMAERIIRDARSRGIEHVILRSAGIYGPRNLDDVSYWFITTYANTLASRFIIGDGKRVLQFVHVSDIVQAITLALDRFDSARGRTYIISDSRAYSYEEIYAIMAKIFGKRPPSLHIPIPLAKVMVAPIQLVNSLRRSPNFIWRVSSMNTFKVDRNYSVERAKRELGYEPKYSLPVGLEETANWYKDNGYIRG